MLLPDRDLRLQLLSGKFQVEPLKPSQVQPASIDVTLDDTFLLPSTSGGDIDPREPADEHERVVIPEGQSFRLMPRQFVLASTAETVSIPDYLAAFLVGKSSLARAGLVIESAGLVDPGFRGGITLELCNLAPRPILLWPGMPIGQMYVLRMTTSADRPYGSPGLGSKYQGQRGATAARSSEVGR